MTFYGTVDYIQNVLNLSLGYQPDYEGPKMYNHDVLMSDSTSVVSVTPSILSEVEYPEVPSMQIDYYDQTYMIPEQLNVDNPQVGTGQRYSIWNARHYSNDVIAVDELNVSGWLNSLSTPDTIPAYGLRDYTLTLQPDAPITVDATYVFDLDYGDVQLRFNSSLASILANLPEIPITETLVWLTDILTSQNGTEQRISLSDTPKRLLNYAFTLISEEEVLEARKNLYTNTSANLIFPLWFETFEVTQEAASGTLNLSGDFTFRNFDTDDVLYLYNNETGSNETIQVASVTDTLITAKNVLNNTYPLGSVVMPSAVCSINDRSQLDKYPVNAARIELDGQETTFKTLVGTGAVVDTFNSLPVLDKRPANNDLESEALGLDMQVLDYGVRRRNFTFIDNPYLVYDRTFVIPNRASLQYWKKFLDTVKGRQKSFVMPTHREDLYVTLQPSQGGSSFEVNGAQEYRETLFPNPSLRALAITTADGVTTYHTVDSVTEGTLANSDSVSVSPAFSNTADGSSITKISFLLTSRLDSDTVTFTHFGTYSEISLRVRTI